LRGRNVLRFAGPLLLSPEGMGNPEAEKKGKTCFYQKEREYEWDLTDLIGKNGNPDLAYTTGRQGGGRQGTWGLHE